MDLEEESPKSKFEEWEEKESGTPHKMLLSDEIRADSYGEVTPEELHKLSGANESGFTDRAFSGFESPTEAVGSPPTVAKPIGDETAMAETTEFHSNSTEYPLSATAVSASTPVLTKGSGLRKWRRIRRDLKKDGSSSAESAQILKRRLPNNEPSKNRDENKLKSKAESEDLVASVESRNAEINPLPVGAGALDLDLELLSSGGFSIGMDSDNSEDHSSKSSTAASAPRLRHEALASGRERGRVKNFGGKGSNRLGLQKAQLGRGGTVDASKQNKGNLARFEKENSLSSVESDLRSSVVGVVQWGSMVDSNGKRNGRSSNFDEHSDEVHTGEEVRSGYYKENGKVENIPREDLDAELLENSQKSENCQSSSDLDPFIKSMVFLQEAQEALEKEIQKIAAIGKEQDDNDRLFEGMDARSSLILEAHLVDLRKKVENLESKLEEASTTIEAKEQKLRELEAVLSKAHFPKMAGTSTHVLPIQALEEEVNSELEVLLKEKMEAEIEYLILTRITQNWKILSEDHIALFKEQRYLAGDQEQMMLKLRDAEDKAIKLNEKTEKLEAYCKELLGMENVLRLQNKVCKFSLCFIGQLMLLCFALGLFLMQLLSPADGVVPT